MSKRPIIKCPNCDLVTIEVRKDEDGYNQYPKEDQELVGNKVYREYRFYCAKCKKEWLYETRPDKRYISNIPKTSQFFYNEKSGLLVLNPKNKDYQKYKKMFKNLQKIKK